MGIGGDGLGQVLRQLEKSGVLADAVLPVGSADAEDVRHKVQIFDAGHVVVQVRVIRDIGKGPLALQRLGPDGLAVHIDFPLVELQDTRHGFQGGGLARPVVADEAVNLPRGDVQVQVVHGLFLAVGLG